MIPVLANQATATKRRMIFHLVLEDGITPATGETGGQPQISVNGGAFTSAGIGILTHTGNGRYYADVTQAAVATAGDTIDGRYRSAATAECPCREVIRVVAYDPDDAAALGLSRLDAAITTRASQATADAIAAAVDTEVAAILAAVDTEVSAIKGKTDQLAFTNAGKVDAAIVDALSLNQAAADKVWSTASRTLTAGVDLTAGAIASAAVAVWNVLVNTLTTAGSIGKYIMDQLGTIGSDPLESIVPGDYPSGSAGAALGRIGSGQISYVSPLSSDGTRMDVMRGDDYLAVDARAFVWTDGENMWMDPLASATFTARIGGVMMLTKACVVTVATGAGKQVQLDLTADETAALELGMPAYRFDVELVDDEGHKDSSQIRGRMFVAEDQTHG